MPKTTAPKPEAYAVSITAILERKYHGNETNIARFISFRFKFFRFVSVCSYFLVSVSVFVNGIKIFPLTDISVFVSVNINHTGIHVRNVTFKYTDYSSGSSDSE